MAVLPPLDSDNSESEEDLEYLVPIPKTYITHSYDSDLDCDRSDSNSDTSSTPLVQDFEEIIENLDDLPIYDDAGVNLDTYFHQDHIFLQNSDMLPLDLCPTPENLCTSVEPVNMCNQDSNNLLLSSTPISHTSPNAHLSHNSTASSFEPRKSVRLTQRVDSFDSVPSSFVQSVEPPQIISTYSNKKKTKDDF